MNGYNSSRLDDITDAIAEEKPRFFGCLPDSLSGWWLKKYESQLGLLFPINAKQKQKKKNKPPNQPVIDPFNPIERNQMYRRAQTNLGRSTVVTVDLLEDCNMG